MNITPPNLIKKHPAYWNKYKIFKTLIQTLYLSAECETWHSRFNYELTSNILCFTTKQANLSYEWRQQLKYAISCSCIHYHWNITISSHNWSVPITPNTVTDILGNLSLLYKSRGQDRLNQSTFILSPISQEDMNSFIAALYSFYYPENPLLGKLIWKNKDASVYTVSDMPISYISNQLFPFNMKGIIFNDFQIQGSLPFSIIVCKHCFPVCPIIKETLHPYDIVKIIYQITEMINPYGAEQLLPYFFKYWNSYPRKQIDLTTWYYVICQLIRKIASSLDSCKRFKSQYPYLFYGERIYNNNVLLKNKRKWEKVWMKTIYPQYRLVQEQFKLLGYKNLETSYQQEKELSP